MVLINLLWIGYNRLVQNRTPIIIQDRTEEYLFQNNFFLTTVRADKNWKTWRFFV